MAKHRKLRPEEKQQKSFAGHIREFFNENFRAFYNPRQIARKVGAKNEMQKREVVELLDGMVKEGFLLQESPGRYRRNAADLFLSGTFVRDHSRLSIVPDNGGDALYVSENNARHALSGDKVEYLLISRGKYRGEAEVTDITKRCSAQQIVGTVEKAGIKETTLRVDSRAFDFRVYVPTDQTLGAKEGEKVVARLTDWPPYNTSPSGAVIEILGKSGENDTEMHAILAEFGLPTHYPEELEKLADEIDDRISADEIARREDFRDITTFTIDPADAKDFDDALSLRRLSDGKWEVGVHIADVTHYVKPGSPIDREAYQRGTSVYLVDRTVPMLPERLCNQICSLRPNEEKLCFSVVFELDDNGKVLKSHIARTVIRSDRRFAYEEAQQIAAEIVAKPGTSDHQTGLAVDILDKEYEVLDYSKMDSKFFDWLDANCAQFGFIKRYPSNKKSVTGWDEPWHYRYVGKEVAEFIMKNGMCLEEFAAHYK